MEKRRWRTRLIVVAVLAVLVLVFGPKKLGWLVPGPDEAVTGYVMYELFSGSGAHDPAGEGLEELRAVLDDTWVLWWGVSNSIPMKDREVHEACVQYGTEADGYVNYVKGANVAGFMKVAKAMMAQGIV